MQVIWYITYQSQYAQFNMRGYVFTKLINIALTHSFLSSPLKITLNHSHHSLPAESIVFLHKRTPIWVEDIYRVSMFWDCGFQNRKPMHQEDMMQNVETVFGGNWGNVGLCCLPFVIPPFPEHSSINIWSRLCHIGKFMLFIVISVNIVIYAILSIVVMSFNAEDVYVSSKCSSSHWSHHRNPPKVISSSALKEKKIEWSLLILKFTYEKNSEK